MAGRIEEIKKIVTEQDRSTREKHEELSEIVKRLKKSEVASIPAEDVAAIDVPGRVGAPGGKLNFGNVKLGGTKGLVRSVGNFYKAFEGPLSTLALFFSALPVTKQLRKDLVASGIAFNLESYLVLSTSLSVAAALLVIVFISTLGITAADFTLNASIAALSVSFLLGLTTFIGLGVLSLLYPSIKADSRARVVDKELPFALRQLATQIKAGVSFNRAFASIANADYGLLSREIRKVLDEMEKGVPSATALNNFSSRIKSKGLKRAVVQINRALRSGGSLSEIVSTIADDVAFETGMRVRDFTEKLNLLSVVFIMIAVVAPVVLAILSAVMQLPILGGGFDPLLLTALFALFCFGMLGSLFVIKAIEPS
ncbi:type II secretion system F family protein [Candidatus Micrarchaeota archaeon]|nr:type II secretion system F family protein [Candidatus Micrarchaeota archaeon]